MAGWIKISKEINTHWIWKDPIKFKWWIDILLTVNYADAKVNIGYKIFECKRGETLLSLLSWSKRWGVSKSVVNNFFSMLENDNMIETHNEIVTTRLKVCNYDSYQQNENAFKTETKRKQNATKTQQYTTKEVEEEEEIKEVIFMSEIKISDDTNFNLKTAYYFWELFCKNIISLGVKNSTIQKTKCKSWEDDIRLMISIDKRSKQEIRKVYEFLRDEEITDKFCWKRNVLSTASLRKQFEKLLISANSKQPKQQTNIFRTTD